MDFDAELKKKFPIVYSCPYKEDILECFKKGHSAYSVDKWLNKKEKIISKSRLSDLKKWLDSINYITPKTKDPDITPTKNEVDSVLITKMFKAAKSLNFEKMSDNVKVQFILGVYKVVFGNKYMIDSPNMTLDSLFDDELIDEILESEEE